MPGVTLIFKNIIKNGAVMLRGGSKRIPLKTSGLSMLLILGKQLLVDYERAVLMQYGSYLLGRSLL